MMMMTMKLPVRKRAKSDQCKICGDVALYSYFGVVACQACKMFFKRYGENTEKKLICRHHDQCEIRIDNRHACNACRLKKCLTSGMQRELIRHSARGKKSCEQTQTKPMPTSNPSLSTLHLLERDVSTLTNHQWTLLTNLIHNYDLSKLYFLIQRVKGEEDQKHLSLMIVSNQRVIIQELLISFYRAAGDACRQNSDIQNLSLSDRSIILHTAIDNMTCLAGNYACAETKLVNHRGYNEYLLENYGKEAFTTHWWAARFASDDHVIFKLALALFSLSTLPRSFQMSLNDEIQNIRALMDIENKYAELVWRYLMYRYTFRDAVQRYFHMVRWFLAIAAFMYDAHCTPAHVNDMQSLIEETELNLILDDVDEVIEAKS